MTCLHEEIRTWYFEDTNQPVGMWSCKSCGHKFVPIKLWVGLTDEEIDGIYKTHHDQYGKCQTGGFDYERSIEAKLKEKNT